MGFAAFGLAETIMQGIDAAGYTIPTEIQTKAIPPALQGKDIIGCAPTGTGKTAAFVLPIVHRIHDCVADEMAERYPRALILAPTRELTQQIAESAVAFGCRSGLRALPIYGGVQIRDQLRGLRRGVEIIAATPGRLLDHIRRGTLDLSRVEILILDEADRMYDMGFIKDVKTIIKKVPSKRQTMLFSATMSGQVRRLTKELLRNPQSIEVAAPGSLAQSIQQHFYAIDPQSKKELLPHILKNETIEKMLVFSRTKSGADRLSRWLISKGFPSAALHADRTQHQRRRVLERFRQGRYRVLVATDIAARGIDVAGISHVVNFDAPVFAEDYVHRIGRTGRAACGGTAITFVTHDEEKYVHKIERLVGRRFSVAGYPGYRNKSKSIFADTKPSAGMHTRRGGGRSGSTCCRVGRACV